MLLSQQRVAPDATNAGHAPRKPFASALDAAFPRCAVEWLVEVIRTVFPMAGGYHLDSVCSIEDGVRPADDADVMRERRAYAEGRDSRHLPGLPVVHLGVIASANFLLKSSGRRDDLRRDFSILAVEMESSGIGDAAWFSGVGYLIIRGVCDYCDAEKSDVWQGYAAGAAAAYLRALLEATPTRSTD